MSVSRWIELAGMRSVANLARGGKRGSHNSNRASNAYRTESLGRRVMLASALAAFAAQQTFGTGNGPNAVATADFNGDGRIDLVVPNDSSGTVSVMLGNGNGTFGAPQSFGVGAKPYPVAVGDMNGDG